MLHCFLPYVVFEMSFLSLVLWRNKGVPIPLLWLLLGFYLYFFFQAVSCACNLLSSLDLWVYSFHQIWEIFCSYVFRYFSILSSFLLPAFQLYIYIYQAIWSCSITCWCSVHFFPQSFSLCWLILNNLNYRILKFINFFPCSI